MPHKLTGKSLYKLMFNRKMQTKLPQLEVKNNGRAGPDGQGET